MEHWVDIDAPPGLLTFVASGMACVWVVFRVRYQLSRRHTDKVEPSEIVESADGA